MRYQFIDSIHHVAPNLWNGLLDDDHPFVRHEFFAALEDSGSTTAERGWQPHHLLLWEGELLRAALPLFVKQHSYGEYVFDWGWANAYAQHGYDYYPKLLTAIPFTPCRGPRLLGSQKPHQLLAMVQALQEESRSLGASGWHCLFPESPLSELLAEQGAPQRLGCQYHWYNRGYSDFTDFLSTMSSRKRKNILKERRQVAAQGFEFEHKAGGQISTADWDWFYSLYQLTYLKRSGHGGYLERGFFRQLGETMPEHCLMVRALRDGEPLAAALFLRDRDCLYGRYWGCREEFDYLHFETCYYQGIDYAIAHGLGRFDGGAQGEHKLARGFEPVLTLSNHWMSEPVFRSPIQRFLTLEASEVQSYLEAARAQLPYKASE
ncbi:GNAT family N-acetyltransferase [Marinimicrobium sp. ABcell2]|uniref:GNAT family N-acetyltransferase n=1 Tax=Marinimicrobium sp. ABcell2 TaxID=3069751 RepID=UPI0027AFFEE1|nr:GNAT family N-acetyltransferase [Marinimicrobium sp. ABcell2]MDQ2076944.1 GNAT family N-acetyltransferase [Marinimicrobium sp. ABcell2]